MRTNRALMALFCLTVFASPAVAAQPAPYKALVNGSDVYVRSGPGKNYYPTDKLQRGFEVEVFRHDPGGWCAIRPPQGSFSWVAARNVKPLKEDYLAEITTDKTVAYVGSRFRDVRDVRQVQLDKGDVVEVLGEKRFAADEGGVTETWYKVAPPSGEFRWVYRKLLLKQEAETPVASKQAARNSVASLPREQPQPKPVSLDAEPVAVQPAGFVARGTSKKIQQATALVPEAEQRTSQRSGEAAVKIAAAAQPTSQPKASSASSSEINAIDLDVTLMIAKDPSEWNFVGLRSRTQDAISVADSALSRGRARAVLREIEKYETKRKEFESMAEVRKEIDRKNRLAEAALAKREVKEATRPVVKQANVTKPIKKRKALGRFDGVGRLTTVRSKRIGAPRYALTNSKADVLVFVTPTPGVSLKDHVGKVVGLSGIRSYLPRLKRPHLAVKRVEVVEETALKDVDTNVRRY